MFNMFMNSESMFGDRMAGACAAISSALAYTDGLEDSSITAVEGHGVIYLEGVASNVQAIETAIELASSIAGCAILSHIEPAY